MAIDTGQGSVVTFGTTTTWTPLYTTIGGPGWTRDSIDTSSLSTTGARTMIGGDLWGIAPISSSFLVDSAEFATTENNSIDDLLFDSAAMTVDETITLTLGTSEASTFINGGHVTALEMEDLTTDALLVMNLTFQWDDTPAITE